MIYNSNHKPALSDIKITEGSIETFDDFYKILSEVFKDFDGNAVYQDLIKRSLSGELRSETVQDLVSKIYIIYDAGEPVAAAGLFYSKSMDIAYLHDAGTLEQFRGRGYQKSLISHRVNIALQIGISRIYSAVEKDGQSWKNCISCGFEQGESLKIYTL